MLIIETNQQTRRQSIRGTVAGCPVNIPQATAEDLKYWKEEARENEEGICAWFTNNPQAE